MIDFLMNRLGNEVGVLSRGYGRKTKGYVEVTLESTPEQVGDEPLMLKLKHPTCQVAVCEKRTAGILQLLFEYPDLKGVLLDDNLQHRYVKPSFQIVLSEYGRPFYKDRLLPEGRLREGAGGLVRTNILVVTKCPKTITEAVRQRWVEQSGLPKEKVFFSHLEYAPLRTESEGSGDPGNGALVVAGIDNTEPLSKYLTSEGIEHTVPPLKDHQHYSMSVINKLLSTSTNLGYTHWITTEKDWVKIRAWLPQIDHLRVDVLPIKMVVDREDDLLKLIQQHGPS